MVNNCAICKQIRVNMHRLLAEGSANYWQAKAQLASHLRAHNPRAAKQRSQARTAQMRELQQAGKTYR